MKLLYNRKLFIQKIDLIYLFNFYSEIPNSVLLKILKEIILIDEKNKYDLVEFNNKSEIEFLNNLEYILDYKRVKNLNYEEKEKLCDYILNKSSIIENEIKKLLHKGENSDKLNKEWELYNYMYYSLNYLVINDDSIKKLIKEKN